jgi:DNA-binding MarR family transcriptional regulator
MFGANARKISMPTYEAMLLKSQAFRAMNTYMARTLAKYGLTGPDWTLVGLLTKNNAMQPTEIAERLGVKPPVVTAALKRLLTKNIIKKDLQIKDNRKITVTLTAKGKKMAEQVEKNVQDDFKSFMKGVKQSDIDAYFSVLEKISNKLNERAPGS